MNALSCFSFFLFLCVMQQYILTRKRISEVFSPGQMMEGDVMDFLIDDWKQDPDRNADFASGKRILLSPYFITVINQIGFFLLNKSAYCFYEF